MCRSDQAEMDSDVENYDGDWSSKVRITYVECRTNMTIKFVLQ